MRITLTTLAAVVTLFAASTALADVLWVGGGTGRGLRQEVDIQGVEGNELVYLINGNRASTPMERVQQIEFADEPRLTAAEVAFATGDWASAATAYREVAEANSTEWIRQRSAQRLVEAAGLAGLFDESVIGYVSLVRLDVFAALGREPPVPSTATADQLRGAERRVEEALAAAAEDEQRKALLTFLLQLNTRRGDDGASQRTIARLTDLMGDAVPTTERDRKLFAQVLLGRATLAMAEGKPAEARSLIEDNESLFTEPERQAEALLLLGRAAEAEAGSNRTRLLNAALEYMNVVAQFKTAAFANQADSHVADALLAAGGIHERLGLDEDAASLYEDLVARYATSTASDEAQRRLDALKNPTAPTTAPADPSSIP